MAKVTWLGEDQGDIAGPSFTTCFGMRFDKGKAVEVSDPDSIARAKKNQFFDVTDDEAEADESDGLDGMKIAELRDLAEANGIDHTDMSKADLREALRNVQNAG